MHKYFIVVIDNADNDNLILDICTYDNYHGFIEGKKQLENAYKNSNVIIRFHEQFT
jgi:hypothetical protein